MSLEGRISALETSVSQLEQKLSLLRQTLGDHFEFADNRLSAKKRFTPELGIKAPNEEGVRIYDNNSGSNIQLINFGKKSEIKSFDENGAQGRVHLYGEVN